MNHNKQAVGAHFDLQKMHIARDKTFDAVNAIAQQITVGMSEADARELAKDSLNQEAQQDLEILQQLLQ